MLVDFCIHNFKASGKIVSGQKLMPVWDSIAQTSPTDTSPTCGDRLECAQTAGDAELAAQSVTVYSLQSMPTALFPQGLARDAEQRRRLPHTAIAAVQHGEQVCPLGISKE